MSIPNIDEKLIFPPKTAEVNAKVQALYRTSAYNALIVIACHFPNGPIEVLVLLPLQLQHVIGCPSFLWLNHIPLYIYIISDSIQADSLLKTFKPKHSFFFFSFGPMYGQADREVCVFPPLAQPGSLSHTNPSQRRQVPSATPYHPKTPSQLLLPALSSHFLTSWEHATVLSTKPYYQSKTLYILLVHVQSLLQTKFCMRDLLCLCR